MRPWTRRALAVVGVLAGCEGDPGGPGPGPAGPLEGTWQGWSDGITFRLALREEAGARVSGSGRMLGFGYELVVSGTAEGERVSLTLDPGAGREPMAFTGTRAGSAIRGELRGLIYDGDSLNLRLLDPGASSLPAWTRAAPTPHPEQIGGLLVQGDLWLAPAGHAGLMVSLDGGRFWSVPVSGFVNGRGVALHPTLPGRVVAAARDRLFVSEDGGRSWAEWGRFEHGIRSVHVAGDGTIWVAPQWPANAFPGIFRSRGWSRSFDFLPFGGWVGEQILTWDVLQVPGTGTLLLANEIADHPQPYRPPFLRSGDGGRTWSDVSGSTLWWHSVALAHDPATGTLFTLQEGPGLYASRDDGRSWERVSRIPGFVLWLDTRDANTVLVGPPLLPSRGLPGGAYRSRDGGVTFEPLGFEGAMVVGFARDRSGRLLAAVRGEGIFVAGS